MMTYSFSMKTFVQACLRNYVSTALPKTVHEMRGLALTLGTETAASPATHLRILRSSNHSSNKPYVVVNYTDNYLGGAVPFVESTGEDTRCLEYALQMYKINNRSRCFPVEGDTVYTAANKFIKYLTYYGINISRLYNGYTQPVSSPYYRVAMRISNVVTDYYGNRIVDAHFWRETSNAQWAHKMGGLDAEYIEDTDYPDGVSVGWQEVDFTYLSPTVYFQFPNNHPYVGQSLTLYHIFD